jgi:DNA-directed RNA polymerase specialized sigma24 family protein
VRTVPVDEAATLADWRVGDPVLRGDLERALGALEPAQREAFLLVVVLGLSYQEAGGMTGCPAGTVASRVFRARTRLAAALSMREEDPA